MSYKFLGPLIGVLVFVGGFVAITSLSDDSETEPSSSSSSEVASTDANEPTFAPVNTFDESFVATISGTTEGQSFSAILESDGNGVTKFSSTDENGSSFEFYNTPDSTINCSEGQCVKLPSSGEASNTEEYTFNQSDFDKFKETAEYEGEEDCPAGKCDVWLVADDDVAGNPSQSLETKIYISKKDQRISQVVGMQNGEVTTIVYEFKDVTITLPENVQELPNFNS